MDIIGKLKQLPQTVLLKIDLMILLNLIFKHGVSLEQVHFESHLSLNKATHIMKEIKFKDNQIFITLNMGLLSSNSPIPENILDYLTTHDDKLSFNVLHSLSNQLLKNHLSLLMPEHDPVLNQTYLNGNMLFMKQDGCLTSTANMEQLFLQVLSNFDVQIQSGWEDRLVEKSSQFTKNSQLGYTHLGGYQLQPKLHFKLKILMDSLLTADEQMQIIKQIEQLILNHILFAQLKPILAVTLFLAMHPVQCVYLPTLLDQTVKLENYQCKIYERNSYEAL